MFPEDDPPRQKPRFTPLPLDALGVDELQAYVAALQAEIARAEAEIARKRSHTADASRLFKF